MVKNFLSMPLLLKILTAATLTAPAFCIHTLFAPTVSVFGKDLAVSEWMASGAGIASVVLSGLLVAAAVLMLQRSRYGRPVYIGALMTMTLAVQVLAGRFAADAAVIDLPLASNLGLAALAGVYLYWNKAVRNYFQPSSAAGGHGGL